MTSLSIIGEETDAFLRVQSNELGEQIWVVIAAYNEASRLGQTLQELVSIGKYRVVVVDDGSIDHTAKVAGCFPVWLLRHPVNCGQGAALRTGIEFALSCGAEFVVTFDADGQHDASEIERLYRELVKHRVDVVLGSRFLGKACGIPLLRRGLLQAAVKFTRLTTGLKLTDAHNGFRVLTRRAAETICIEQNRMAHASEILEQIARFRLPYIEAPVTIRYTPETLRKGQSTWDAIRISGQLIMGRFVK